MKKLLLAIFIFLSLAKISAQNEYLQNNPQWTVMHVFSPNYPCIEYDSVKYYLNGDSIINSLVYKQLWKCGHISYSWQSPQPNPGCNGNYTYCDTIAKGFVRSQGLQMYYIPLGDTAEQLLHDFNLTIGSQLPITYTYCCPAIETVSSIDSIYTPYGYRKRFWINNGNDYVVEGIGSAYGLIEPWGPQLDQAYSLVCYGLNDTAYFPSQGPYCDVITTIPMQTQQESSLQLVPNPATDYVDVQLSGMSIDLIEVFDARGQKVKSQRERRINTTGLSEGIYFVRVISGENLLIEKLLVE
jgi:hypothetical protein